MDPIYYGDLVGLAHPGTNTRITREGQEFLHFKVLGGKDGEPVPNGGVISLAQDPPGKYWLITDEEQWKITTTHSIFSKDSPPHTTARVKLEAIPAGSREPQLYIIYKLQLDPIEHVVLLMMENRSFFRVYGYMDPNRDNYVNYSESGKEFRSAPSDDIETPDPPHEIPFVNISLEGEKHDGYVKAYEKYLKERNVPYTDADLQDIMGYTRKGFLPALHKMEHFASICSQWYCSLRGPTWPNRMFGLSGTCFNWRTTPEMNPNILTELNSFLSEWHMFKPVAPQRFSIFDILDDKKVSYNIYTATPLEFTLAGDVFYPTAHDADIAEFNEHAKAGSLPAFSFLEPNFVEMPDFGFTQNDDHPPASPIKAQRFIADVYNTLLASPKWKNTLFIVTYDEHGGFFDPVIPPAAPVPDAVSQDEQGTFATFGVRVPTVLVSPCVKHGIDDTVYDHTSVLKYVLQKWAPESVGHLGERVKHANTLPVLRVPRTDEFPPILDSDFKSLEELLAANNKAEAPAEKRLRLHEAAAVAIKDPEVERGLRAIIVEKYIAHVTAPPETQQAQKAQMEKMISQAAKASVQIQAAQATQPVPVQVREEVVKKPAEGEKAKDQHQEEGVVEHALHEIKAAGEAIAHAFTSFFGGGSEEHPVQTTPYPEPGQTSAPPQATSSPVTTPAPVPPPTATTTTATTTVVVQDSAVATIAAAVVSEALRQEAERWADDAIRKIAQGQESTAEAHPDQARAFMAIQIRALSMKAEKHQGSNDLAKTYLKLMHLKADEHAQKKQIQGKKV